jgi:hypothetical protein
VVSILNFMSVEQALNSHRPRCSPSGAVLAYGHGATRCYKPGQRGDEHSGQAGVQDLAETVGPGASMSCGGGQMRLYVAPFGIG